MSTIRHHSDPTRSFDGRKWLLVALVVVAATAGAGVAAFTPSTDVPVGIAQVGGISMTPTFGPSGVAVYADAGGVGSGDVVMFFDESSERYIMHRVVETTSQGLVTQGDAYTATDQSLGRSYVTDENRVGEVFVVVDSKGVHFPAF